MVTSNGIANAIGFGRQTVKDTRVPFYMLFDDGSRIALDNNDLLIAK